MRRILVYLLFSIACTNFANADLNSWLVLAKSTQGNAKASTNMGNSYVVKGAKGTPFDYGDLSNGNKLEAGVGATVEYIFKYDENRFTQALGGFSGSGDKEVIVVKLGQWAGGGCTEFFGLTVPTVIDCTFKQARSIYGQKTHVAIVNRPDGRCEIYVNGKSKGIADRKVNWVINGGVGHLGAHTEKAEEAVSGTIYGVASYKRALSSSEIEKLHRATL